MWIAIIGASSTGKRTIGDILKRRDFKEISKPKPFEDESGFMLARIAEHLEAQSVMFNSEVFTYRTIWDSFSIMSKSAMDNFIIQKDEYDRSNKIFDLFNNEKIISPPNMVVFTRMEKKDVQNRTLLSGRRPDDALIAKEMSMYDDFIARVKVPKIELNMSLSPEVIAEELYYGIDSVKSMVLTQRTIWSRSMFY